MQSTLPTDPMEATRVEIEAAVAQWRALRAERLAAEKVAAEIKVAETHYKDFIVAAMRDQHYEGIVKDGRMTYVRTSQVPSATNRQEFEEYILEQRDLSLVQFRPAVGAIKERWEAGVSVPGIEMLDTYELGDRKA